MCIPPIKPFRQNDSHRTVTGPLHGVCKQKLKKSETYRWQAHNVRDYIGHRVHVEFTPKGPFSLARVQFAGKEPPPVFRIDPRLAERGYSAGSRRPVRLLRVR